MHERFVKEEQRGPRVVFLGDSLTFDWGGDGRETWDRLYAPLGAANFGIGGDRTSDVLWRIEHGELGNADTRLVVLMIGTNDLGNGATPEETSSGVRACVEAVRRKLPLARVLLLGILPRGGGDAQTPLRQAIARTNDTISRLDDGGSVRYRDIGPAFLKPDGTVRPELYLDDLIHLGSLGYAAWADAMRATFGALAPEQ